MELGQDINQKIRSAVKDKLLDLGAYVDDELPDYVMVMVANKKSRAQMTDDLSLFLGANTVKFTTWLHTLLDKLQSINTEKISLKSSEDNSLGDGGGKKEKVAMTTADGATGAGKPLKRRSTEVLEEPEIRLQLEHDDFDEDEVNLTTKKSEEEETRKQSEIEPAAARSSKSASIVQSRHSRKRSYHEAADGRHHHRLDRHPIQSSVGAVLRRDSDDSEGENDRSGASKLHSVVKMSGRKCSIPSSLQAPKTLLLNAIKEAEESVSAMIKKAIVVPDKDRSRIHDRLGRIGDVNPGEFHRHRANSRHEASNDTNNRNVKSSPRREDKQQSSRVYVVVSEEKGGESSDRAEVKARNTDGAVTNNVTTANNVAENRDNSTTVADDDSCAADSPLVAEQNNIQLYPYEIDNDVEMLDDAVEIKFSPDDDVASGLPQSGTVNEATSVTGADSFVARRSKSEEKIGTRKILVSENEDKKWSALVVSPPPTDLALSAPPPSYAMHAPTNFIVTLNGASNHLDEELLDYDEDFEMIEETEDNNDLVVGFNNQRNSWSRNFVKVTPPLVAAETPGGNYQPFIISDTGDDDDEEEEGQGEPAKKSKFPERCKYWPKCKAGEDCVYHHPTVPCKSFPNCYFKEKCLYIHPNCRFDLACTNPRCPFTHTTPRSILAATPTVIVQPIRRMPAIKGLLHVADLSRGRGRGRPPVKTNLPPSQVKCKFFPRCVDMNCSFSHPKPCRYGVSCGNKSACPFGHPLLPSKDKLKWIAKPEEGAVI